MNAVRELRAGLKIRIKTEAVFQFFHNRILFHQVLKLFAIGVEDFLIVSYRLDFSAKLERIVADLFAQEG